MYRVSAEVRSLAKTPLPTSESEVAVYSEDRPIEFWRGLPGFVEARDIESARD